MPRPTRNEALITEMFDQLDVVMESQADVNAEYHRMLTDDFIAARRAYSKLSMGWLSKYSVVFEDLTEAEALFIESQMAQYEGDRMSESEAAVVAEELLMEAEAVAAQCTCVYGLPPRPDCSVHAQ